MKHLLALAGLVAAVLGTSTTARAETWIEVSDSVGIKWLIDIDSISKSNKVTYANGCMVLDHNKKAYSNPQTHCGDRTNTKVITKRFKCTSNQIYNSWDKVWIDAKPIMLRGGLNTSAPDMTNFVCNQ